MATKPCHGGLLLGRQCYVDAGSWRRVCKECLKDTLEVPASQCRIVASDAPNQFTSGRSYFVSWKVDGATVSSSVRPFVLADTDRMLLVFASEKNATDSERRAPPGMLRPAAPEERQMRMCCMAKSFCPAINFGTQPESRSCKLHHMARVRPQAAPRPPQVVLGAGSPVVHPPCIPAECRDLCADGSSASDAQPFDALAGPSEPSTPTHSGFSSDLASNPDDAQPSKRARDDGRRTPSGAGATAAPGEQVGLEEAISALIDEHFHGSGSSLPPLATQDVVDQIDGGGAWPHALASRPTVGGSASGGASRHFGARDQPEPSQSVLHTHDVEVRGALRAHGPTLKSGGSAMWTVVSDARLKEVVGDFPLGVDELMQLRPRVFRYNGLAGTARDGREYVGLVAQEVPPALAPYCRVRAQVRLRPSDASPTDIFMLDHSAFPFLTINSVQDHQRALQQHHRVLMETELRLRALEQVVGTSTPRHAVPPRRVHEPMAGSASSAEDEVSRGCLPFIACFCAAGPEECVVNTRIDNFDETTPLLSDDVRGEQPTVLVTMVRWLMPSVLIGVTTIPPLLNGVSKSGSIHELMSILSHSALAFGPCGLYILDAFLFPDGDVKDALPPGVLLANGAMAAAMLALGLQSLLHTLSRDTPWNPVSAGDLLMETVFNGLMVPMIIFGVSIKRLGPWGALRMGLYLIVAMIWFCAAGVWLWTGGMRTYNYLDMPLNILAISSVVWLGVARMAAPDLRPRVCEVLHSLANCKSMQIVHLQRSCSRASNHGVRPTKMVYEDQAPNDLRDQAESDARTEPYAAKYECVLR